MRNRPPSLNPQSAIGTPHSAIRSPQSALVSPLLKWAGGKRQLLPQLRRFYPRTFNRYIEPFFGSGAVFFDLHAAGRLQGRDVLLIDSNADLIGCYDMVRAQPDAVADELERLAEAHARGGDAQYYAVRDQQFNPARDRLRGTDGRIAYTPALAAMLIYLNRTGFNLAIGLVVLVVVGGIWMLLNRSGLAAVSNDAVDLLGTGLVTFAHRIAPSLPLYAGAAAVLATALGIWWWAERDAAL
jgi:D12 class N6 adenine-specific DNA methyltransferase